MGPEHDEVSIATIGKDIEKTSVYEVVNDNKHARIGLSNDDAEFFENFPKEKHNRLLRKVDFRLVPVLALLYLCAHIDRANIGNAKIEGMLDDLNMSGIQYNIAVSIFFIPYILLEVPSNIILKRFKRPSTYLGILVVSWGITMTFTGLCKDFGGLMACRVVLAVCEAGFFPGAVYLITRWYAQRQVQTRIALFYCASALSGAFSGLLAFAIAKMDGVGGKAGWAWIFLLEGIATVLIGIACFFVMPDTPALSSRWLNTEEIRYLEIQTYIKEGGRSSMEATEKFKWSYLTDLLTDYKVYLQAFILFTASVCAYGLKFTMPSITKSMGYTSSQAQLMTIPPYVAGAIAAISFSKLADRYQWRMPFILGPMTLVLIGFCILFPLAKDIRHQIPASGDTKRAMGIALNICIGNSGGILGSYMFLDSEQGAGYPTGFGIGIGLSAAVLLSTLVLEWSYWSINKKRDAMTEGEIHAKYNEEQLNRMGDKSPLYRYKL
ncbi:MFS general substrate transporter [Hortaea werneckii]|nr:MFS general substrate transporter [Hortaea werneckii]KAI6885037.1 MFS general substrate transporter [Hortaea werneckii]KAI6994592.1 MFS general substrate transporter [Hortaea werneckii]KAI7146249.1 MFS general substrate transporter [Hortaea werneckii]KAI7175059.1 MFS general substrate transporter [Hortaea werneckii]